MQTTRARAAVLAVGIAAAMSAPAAAHIADAVTPNRAGPIRRDETTMRQLRRWFGEPTTRRVVEVGCIEVVKARWDDDLMVYAYTDSRAVGAIFVAARRLTSERHGDLDMHTGKDLRVGDGERRLRRLYPRSDAMTHGGHTHYRLSTWRSGAYLMAKVVDGSVVRLESWPFEFC